MCVTPVTVELGGCMVEIDIHNGYFISDNYEDKVRAQHHGNFSVQK